MALPAIFVFILMGPIHTGYNLWKKRVKMYIKH